MSATILDRARAYVAAMPAAISGQGGHNATFAVACALVKGFNLSVDQARPLMDEYNGRCDPPWSAKQIEHKLDQAARVADAQPRGYLIGAGKWEVGEAKGQRKALMPAPKPIYDAGALAEFSSAWREHVDLVWLANRSAVDPATVTSDDFLCALYRPGERVLVFNECNFRGAQITQGEAVWPDEAVPSTGKYGVWFLPQPVDGEFHPNMRREGNPPSRRSEESCLHFPFLVLESDTAPVRDWLGALVQFPLKIVAIYSSGGRSVHALVRVGARTKREWDEIKTSMAPGLRFMITNGLDKGVLSAVRLSRLPGAWREGKAVEGADGRWIYQALAPRQLQKLLYLNPAADGRPICSLFPKRDVVRHWLKQSELGIGDADETCGAWLRRPLRFYAPVNAEIRAAHQRVEREFRAQTA